MLYDFIWQTVEGKLIPIKSMTDNHLMHTINLIDKKAEDADSDWRPTVYYRMQEEAFNRSLIKIEDIKPLNESLWQW
jgi:hypothetical protein